MLRVLRESGGPSAVVRRQASRWRERLVRAGGGPARLQIIVLLAAVLGLQSADQGMISALSGELEAAFHINNTQIGLLLAAVSFIGAFTTLPIGVLADRIARRSILLVAVAIWGAATLVSGFATSYLFLLLTRIGLGAVTAAAWPCTASLAGDFFPARERARIYGLILAGELIGAGIGYFISGEMSSHLSWRWSFYAMTIPALVLMWALARYLPEPQRGAQSWLSVEDTDAAAATRPHHAREHGAGHGSEPPATVRRMQERQVRPRQELLLHEDPGRRSWWWVTGYLLRLPTYRLLILASALAYYFFAGLRTFSMLYFTEHYGLSRSTVSSLVFILGIAALAGVVSGGRLSERLLASGHITARIVVPGVALAISVPFLGAGIWIRSPWIAVPLLLAGAAALSAAVAPLDAARLDIVPASLWGRGEAGRMALRSLLEGGAPLLFGAASIWLGGGSRGLMITFLVMLIPMLAASSLAIPARRTYPPDVLTAAAAGRGSAGP